MIKATFIVFLYFAMFSRGGGLLGLSGGMTASVLSFVLFFLSIGYSIYYKKQFVISQLAGLIILFLIIIALTPILSTFVYDFHPRVSLRLMIEVAVVGFIFLAVYNFIRSGVITPKFFLYALAIVGLIAALQTLGNLVGRTNIYRIRSVGGVNYVGNTFAMCAVVWMMILYRSTISNSTNLKLRIVQFLCFFVVFVAMLITGTRSATIGFMIGLMALVMFGMSARDRRKYILLSVGFIVITIFILSLKFDLSGLWDRYTFSRIMRMAEIRFILYSRSVTDLTLGEFLVGRPDLYIFGSGESGSRMVNTHNMLLSLIRYHGIQVFILFIVLLSVIAVNYYKLHGARKDKPALRLPESSIIILFIMALVYTMFSGGRPTRAFSFFVALGYLAGYFELLKNVRTQDEYKKMIL